MATIDYAAIAQSALDAIRAAGTTLPLRRTSRTHDAVQGSTSAAKYFEGPVDCVVLPARSSDIAAMASDRLTQALAAGKLRKLLVAASSVPFEPTVVDTITLEAYFWTILGVTPLSPIGLPLIYTLFIERSQISATDAAGTPVGSLGELGDIES